MADDVDPLVERVLAGSKYRSLDPAFVTRVVAEVRPTVRSDAEAVKVAKRRLHQAFGAFTAGRPVAALARAAVELRDAAPEPVIGSDGKPSGPITGSLGRAMRAHASTAERVDHLPEVAALFAGWVGRPGSVVDLACGLGPLATPWLSLAPRCRYRACDIDRAMLDGLAALGPWLPVELTVELVDLVAAVDTTPAEVALVLKAITTLDQQRSGRASEVLAALRCPDIIVSVPTGSLGGGRRYTDPRDLIERTATGGGLVVAADAAIGVEHYAHLRTPGGAR